MRGRWPGPLRIAWWADVLGTPIPAPVFEDSIARALDAWESTGAVRFVRAEQRATADLVLGWHGRAAKGCLPFMTWDGGLAHAGPLARPTFIHLNQDVTWSSDKGGFNLLPTLLHEIGHVLGLGHSNDPEALMHGQYSRSHRTPGVPDVSGLHSLYGGGSDAASDVKIVRFDAEGLPSKTVTILRDVAPKDLLHVGALDTDGDGREEIVTWPVRHRLDGVVTVYHFDGDLRLVHTRGPYEGWTSATATTSLVRTREGRGVLLQVARHRRYLALAFDAAGHPTVRWPPGKPLNLCEGAGDADGDGLIDEPPTSSSTPPWTVHATGKRRAGAFEKLLVRDSSPREGLLFRWENSTRPFEAGCVVLFDGDGDGVSEGALR